MKKYASVRILTTAVLIITALTMLTGIGFCCEGCHTATADSHKCSTVQNPHRSGHQTSNLSWDCFRADTCPSCNGSKKCRVCDGNGKTMSGAECYICSGTGKCYTCSGTGNI